MPCGQGLCMASFYVISLWNYMNREIYANTNSLERVPSLKSLLFRHLLFKLGRAGHGPWAGHASVWSWSWSCNWGRQVCSRCRSPKPAKVSLFISTVVRPSRSVPSLRICTQGSSNLVRSVPSLRICTRGSSNFGHWRRKVLLGVIFMIRRTLKLHLP